MCFAQWGKKEKKNVGCMVYCDFLGTLSKRKHIFIIQHTCEAKVRKTTMLNFLDEHSMHKLHYYSYSTDSWKISGNVILPAWNLGKAGGIVMDWYFINFFAYKNPQITQKHYLQVFSSRWDNTNSQMPYMMVMILMTI